MTLSLRGISIPQRLLLASVFTYGLIFALLFEYGRPGLGLGQGFYVPVILAAAATSAPAGALAGALALFLYEFAIRSGAIVWGDFTNADALTRLASYIAAGLVAGYLARQGRRMLAQSLFVLEDLLELAHGRIEEPGDTGRGSVHDSTG